LINFPVYESVSVSGYALYMREENSPPLAKDLGPGVWVVLGVNGLGKSTLLLIMKSILLGRARVATAGFKGTNQPNLVNSEANIFSSRVPDGAPEAEATATIAFGKSQITITRRLKDLKLVSFFSAKKPADKSEDETALRAAVCKAMGIDDFENVVRAIERCVFSLENKAELIWDLAAQYELFRATLVDSETSRNLREAEGRIISADSGSRNLSAALQGILKRREREVSKQQSAPNVKGKIVAINAELDEKQKSVFELQSELEKLEIESDDLQASYLRSERSVEELASAYEKMKYDGLRHSLSALSQNEQFTILKLISERVCPSCGNQADEAAKQLLERQQTGKCIICGSVHQSEKQVIRISAALLEKAESTYDNLRHERTNLLKIEANLKEKRGSINLSQSKISTLGDKISSLQKQRSILSKQLPESEYAVTQNESSQLAFMRAEIDKFRKEREAAEIVLDKTLESLREAVQAKRKSLETRFAHHARTFFDDQVKLVFAPRTTKVGLYGKLIEFPAFEVDMKGVATKGDFARREGSQVSLSQNYYLDLAFKMAFMDTLGSSGGTLIVDGPETSVDVVFAGLAGELLASFAIATANKHNQVITASNIIDGKFLPNLLKAYRTDKTRRDRTLNLLEIAAPTPALETKRKEYTAAVNKLFAGKSGG
jgi:hypothetical protein